MYGGKYRSWFLVGPPVVALLFILQFTKIGTTLSAAMIIGFGFIASHLIWNIVFTASASMVGRLSQSLDERIILSTSRAQGMSAAGIVFAVTSLPIIHFFTSHTNGIAGFSLASAVYAVLMVLGYLYIYKMTLREFIQLLCFFSTYTLRNFNRFSLPLPGFYAGFITIFLHLPSPSDKV